MAVVGFAAAVWVFLVRWAWNQRLLERFSGDELCALKRAPASSDRSKLFG
jgi:hypothetical protein